MIARPPRLYMGVLGAGLALDWLWPRAVFPAALSPGWRRGGGAALVGAGLLLMAWALGRFRRSGTPVETSRPTTLLVTDGPYAWSRNPMYLALTLLYAGVGVAVDSAWILALLPPLLLVVRYRVIGPEERYLERRFDDRYRAYVAAVRRWL